MHQREIQRRRLGASVAVPVNASLEGDALLDHCRLDSAGRRLLDRAFERLGLSARALGRILKVSRPGRPRRRRRHRDRHVAEAIQYRSLDRRLG